MATMKSVIMWIIGIGAILLLMACALEFGSVSRPPGILTDSGFMNELVRRETVWFWLGTTYELAGGGISRGVDRPADFRLQGAWVFHHIVGLCFSPG